MTGLSPDGIYFGMPNSVYHAEPRLSSSGIKNLRKNALKFWERCEWLNPNYKRVEKDHFQYGDAYHARLLEGREVMETRFAPELDPADYPNAIKTSNDLKTGLKKLGLKQTGNKPDLIKRALEADPDAQIWDVLVERHAEANQGKTLIKPEWFEAIQKTAVHVEANPYLREYLRNGVPEVTVFWTDNVMALDGTGEVFTVPMKVRFDYLKPEFIIDLKTLENFLDLPTDEAVRKEMTSREYLIQTAVYYRGADAMTELLKAGHTFGKVPSAKWLKAVEKKPKTFFNIFQEKGEAPVATGREVPRSLEWLGVADSIVTSMQHRFLEYMERFGTEDIWVVAEPPQPFTDEDFPLYMFGGR